MPAADRKRSRFPDTRWSLVRRAGASDEVIRQQALAELLTIYSPGLRAFLINARHIAPDLADELVQDFVTDKVLAAQLIRHADQRRGKFRNFVLKSLNNFVSSRRQRAARYGGSPEAAGRAEASARAELTDAFDRQWIQQVVADALAMMETECRRNGRADLWEILRVRVVEPVFRGIEPLGYEELIQMFAIDSPRRAMNLLASAKRCFLGHLRVAVSKYVAVDEIDDELTDLRRILAR